MTRQLRGLAVGFYRMPFIGTQTTPETGGKECARVGSLGLVVAIPVPMSSTRKIDREPVREHDPLAAAVAGCGEQFERARA
jgi:hypothetical protein